MNGAILTDTHAAMTMSPLRSRRLHPPQPPVLCRKPSQSLRAPCPKRQHTMLRLRFKRLLPVPKTRTWTRLHSTTEVTSHMTTMHRTTMTTTVPLT